MRLYEIKERYILFLQMVEDGSIPDDAINDTLESIEGELEDKLDNIASLIKSLDAEAGAIYEEEQRLKVRREQKEKTVKNLKEYASATMLQLGKTKIETPRNLISFRKSTSLVIRDEETFKILHPDLCKVETTIKIPKADITALIKQGMEIEGAELQERQNIQIK